MTHTHRIIEGNKHLTRAHCMSGAGGGGFMFFLARDPADLPAIKQGIALSGVESLRFHDIAIDDTGLVIRVDDQ